MYQIKIILTIEEGICNKLCIRSCNNAMIQNYFNIQFINHEFTFNHCKRNLPKQIYKLVLSDEKYTFRLI